MNPEEALQVWRLAKALSPAQAVDEFSPDAWAVVLRDIAYADAEEALRQLGGEQEWIHVSHIKQRVKRIRRDRVLDYGTLPDPPADLDPDDHAAYRRWLAAITADIADSKAVVRPALPPAREMPDLTRVLQTP